MPVADHLVKPPVDAQLGATVALQRSEQARQQVSATRSALFPQIGYSGSARRTRLDINQLAAQQLRDRDAGTPGTIFAEPISLTSEQAYAVASEVSRLREARGERTHLSPAPSIRPG
jgi:outer membrane protein TolC